MADGEIERLKERLEEARASIEEYGQQVAELMESAKVVVEDEEPPPPLVSHDAEARADHEEKRRKELEVRVNALKKELEKKEKIVERLTRQKGQLEQSAARKEKEVRARRQRPSWSSSSDGHPP